jgi:hypothetical protein
MSGIVDPPAEQSVVVTGIVAGANPDDLDTVAIDTEGSEAKLVMTRNLDSFLHRGRG